MTPRKTDGKPEAAYFIPQYRLRGGVIKPIPNKPLRPVPQEAFFPQPAAKAEQQGFPLAVDDFNELDPRDPDACLGYANRYGVLGFAAWTPFEGKRALQGERSDAAVQRFWALRTHQRLMQQTHEWTQPDASEPPATVVDALARDTSELAVSVFLPEQVASWEFAWFEFHSILALLWQVQVLLWERHGPRAAQAEYYEEAPAKLREMTGLLEPHFQHLQHLLHPRFEFTRQVVVSDERPAWRIAAGLSLVQYVAESTNLFAIRSVAPKPDLIGWRLTLDPPCVLNLLYLAYFNALVTLAQPFRFCALAGCTRFARPNSRWCSDKHGATDRQRRRRAAPPKKAAKPPAQKAKRTPARRKPKAG